jgi:hypothetical protein
MGEVEENANLATYLLSDYSSWMSGTVVVLDGGNLPYMAGESRAVGYDGVPDPTNEEFVT